MVRLNLREGSSAEGTRSGRYHPSLGAKNRYPDHPVLSRLFRRLFLERLTAAHQAGRLQFFADQAALAEPAAFKTRIAALRKLECRVGEDVATPQELRSGALKALNVGYDPEGADATALDRRSSSLSCVISA
jgi:hypothetical protein